MDPRSRRSVDDSGSEPHQCRSGLPPSRALRSHSSSTKSQCRPRRCSAYRCTASKSKCHSPPHPRLSSDPRKSLHRLVFGQPPTVAHSQHWRLSARGEAQSRRAPEWFSSCFRNRRSDERFGFIASLRIGSQTSAKAAIVRSISSSVMWRWMTARMLESVRARTSMPCSARLLTKSAAAPAAVSTKTMLD